MAENFIIQFNWQQKPRRINVRKAILDTHSASIPVYQVYKSNVYLFSMMPVVDIDFGKSWELIEKDRLPYLPNDFVTTLGKWIDEYYTSF